MNAQICCAVVPAEHAKHEAVTSVQHVVSGSAFAKSTAV